MPRRNKGGLMKKIRIHPPVRFMDFIGEEMRGL